MLNPTLKSLAGVNMESTSFQPAYSMLLNRLSGVIILHITLHLGSSNRHINIFMFDKKITKQSYICILFKMVADLSKRVKGESMTT